MRTEPSPASLSLARRRLAGLLAHVDYGRVLDLTVRRGEPVFDPPPQVVRTIKIAGRGSSALRPGGDAPVRPEVRDLLDLLRRLGDGTVHRIEVARGVPLFVEVAEFLPPPPADR